MAQRARIALVDDDIDLAETLAEYLSDLGHEVAIAGSVAALRRLLALQPPDLIILDLGLPDLGGLEALRTLRTRSAIPVLILSAEANPIERIVGLELGADDFVGKPAEPQELAARVAGLLERSGGPTRRLVRLETATVDLGAARLLRLAAPPERLGPGEVALLRVLAQQPGRVFSREELMELAPAESLDADDRAIDTRIARLRRKLATEAIVTVRGRGYAFIPPGEAE
ncbi:response regulator transcription factor [Belnapia sp. F-4-1]|uniref:response regulator transcription factor n=1 Tax=Belnapia sp. F-4-1 TaxID=1545443 RepID=UPI0005BE1B37|nr:response regulator transcription factor [Belnapia sp. F-4-1]